MPGARAAAPRLAAPTIRARVRRFSYSISDP